MKKSAITILGAIAALCFLSCVNNQKNPYQNPDNAKIQEATSLSNITGPLKAGAVYSCTVNVYLPALVDSMAVRVGHHGVDSVFYRTSVGDSPLVVFSFSPHDTGSYEMQVILVKTDGKKDSLPVPKRFKALDFSPQVSPVAVVYRASLGDSITVKFHVMARDSNLYAYSTSLSLDPDTLLSHRVYFYYEPLSHVCDDTITRTFKGKLLRDGLKSPLICYAQAFDRANAYSAEVSCTVFVADTIRPKLTLQPPHTALKDSILKLPDSIVVAAFDVSGIDSVKLNGARMAIVSDTMIAMAKQVFAVLSPGVNKDTIIAWDRAGNTDTVFLELAYAGPPTYPPKIKLLDKSVQENRIFDTLFLDTCVIVVDPAITDSAAYKASLFWSITDSTGNQVPSYNSTTRKLIIPVKPDSEWVDTFNLNFKVVDQKGLSDSRVGTFKVNEVPDPPVMNIKTVQSKIAGTPFDTLFLDTCAKDPDNAPSTLLWSFQNGKVFKIDSLFSSRFSGLGKSTVSIKPIFSVFNRHVAVVPIDTTKAGGAAWKGVDTLVFTVRDPGGLSQRRQILFEKYKFNPVIIDTIPFKGILPKTRE
jgi:hypothetical protein